jgi:hypothetical protein
LTDAAFKFACLVEEHELGATDDTFFIFVLLLLIADEDVHAYSGFLRELGVSDVLAVFSKLTEFKPLHPPWLIRKRNLKRRSLCQLYTPMIQENLNLYKLRHNIKIKILFQLLKNSFLLPLINMCV